MMFTKNMKNHAAGRSLLLAQLKQEK